MQAIVRKEINSVEKKSLREWRLAKNLTQQQLANMASVSLSTIIDAEAGRRTPRIENAYKIVDVLEIGVDNVIWKKIGGD